MIKLNPLVKCLCLMLMLNALVIPFAFGLTTYFFDDFETGDLSKWTLTVNSPVVQDVIVANGTYTVEFDANNDYLGYDNLNAPNPYFNHGYYRVDSDDIGAEKWLCLYSVGQSGGQTIFRLVFRNISGVKYLTLYHWVPSVVSENYEFDWEKDTWYSIQTAFYSHESEGYYRVWLNDVLVIDASELNTSSRLAHIFYLGRIGSDADGPPVSYADSVGIYNDSTIQPPNHIGHYIGFAGIAMVILGVCIPAYVISNKGWFGEKVLLYIGYGVLSCLFGYGLMRIWLFGGFS